MSFLHFVRFGKVFGHVGCSESGKHGEISIADCRERSGFDWKPKGGMEEGRL